MVEPEEIKLYQRLSDLSPYLWEDLAVQDPGKVRLRAAVSYHPDHGYVVPYLGIDHRVNPKERLIEVPPGARRPGFQDGLVLVNYLIHASDEGLSGRMVTCRELDGGALFFTGQHAPNTRPVLERYARDPAGFLAAALKMGAAPIPGGDAAFRLLALPKILAAYTLYVEDDEFPAQVTITFDRATDRHLPLDSVWALINAISRRLAEYLA